MRPDLSPIDPDEAVPEVRPDTGRRLRLLPVSVAVLALAGFGAIVWYAYTQGMQGGSAVAPVIRAEPGPTKIRPEQPGGLVVPNQDKMVYNNLMPGGGGGASQQGRAERLLPPPETPVTRPAVPARPSSGVAPPAPAAVVPLPQPLPVPAAAETASTGALPIVPPMPPPTAAPTSQQAARAPTLEPGSYRIQLAATKSEDEARREWQRLQRANTDVLGPLQLTVVRADLGPEKGIFFRIQAGPLNETSARQACDALKARKLGCILVR